MHRSIVLPLILACLLPLAVCLSARAKEPAAEPPLVLLWPAGAPGAVGNETEDRPSLTIYLPPAGTANGCGIVVCPGGGYGGLAVGHEGLDVAEWLNSCGVAAFVLRYRVAPRYHHPAPLTDAQRAVRTVRHRAAEWGVDPARLGIIGFSAGGHLASSVGTHFDAGQPAAADPIERQSCRPDFMILGYPVISFTTEFTHQGSKRNLLGESPDEELVRSFSNELQVTAETPPAFLVHTNEDTPVPSENSVLFYLALRKAGVPAQLQIYERGAHGLGVGKTDPVFATWPGLCESWLRGRGMLGE